MFFCHPPLRRHKDAIDQAVYKRLSGTLFLGGLPVAEEEGMIVSVNKMKLMFDMGSLTKNNNDRLSFKPRNVQGEFDAWLRCKFAAACCMATGIAHVQSVWAIASALTEHRLFPPSRDSQALRERVRSPHCVQRPRRTKASERENAKK